MCLEKIQRANDLMGLNDSSPGEWDGEEVTASPAYPGQPLETGVSAFGHFVESGGGYSTWLLLKTLLGDGVLDLLWAVTLGLPSSGTACPTCLPFWRRLFWLAGCSCL